MKRLGLAVVCAIAFAVAVAGTAQASFPYLPDGGDAHDYSTYRVNQGTVPSDIGGDGNDWKFASTPEPGAPANITSDPMELNGVRGAHVADSSTTAHAAWETTTGRPDVAIAVLDSGIEWNNADAMTDLRKKVRLNRGELPQPEISGPAIGGADCGSYSTSGSDPYDANNDGVFNVIDYACDPRVHLDDHHEGPPGVLTPQDLIVAFSKGAFHGDDDGNGFVDDIAGWDFLDDDNDPFDDVQYGHGTGEAKDSNAEAGDGGQTGSCPNCMVVPLRVGDSFVADVNNFAQAAIYAVDNKVLVIQEALGTLNHSTFGQKAIDYAYNHGVAVIASAADEAAQHHNWPSTYAHTIVVNSVRKYDSTYTPDRQSYLQFNGCTNFTTHLTLAIPSSSCSSNATGVGAGMAGLVYSAALDANDANRLSRDPDCKLTTGAHCVITANEVRQLMASGTITPANADANVPADTATTQADDVNFTRPDSLSCTPVPAPGCTDPNRLFSVTDIARPYLLPVIRSYPARQGFDEFYGYGRVNMVKAAEATSKGDIPPTAEITSPSWYRQIDPAQPNIDVSGDVGARGANYTCVVEVAPGSDPNNASTSPGDFQRVASDQCDGTTVRSAPFSGTLAQLNLSDLEARFPAGTDFTGRETQPGAPNFNNRPNPEPYGFTVRVVVTLKKGAQTLTGQDRRNFFLHKDKDLLPGFPKEMGADGASSPALADLDGDNRNEVVFGTSDGDVHAYRADGTELPGWPVHVDPNPIHTGGRAFTSGEVSPTSSRAAILASPAVGDIDHDGVPEVVVADFKGKLYVFNADGSLKFAREADPDYSGKPLHPYENVRLGQRYRTQHGFFASPVLANLDASPDGKLDIIAAGLDRHVYAWNSGGGAVPGFPVTVVDRSKTTALDPVTNAPTFKPDAELGDPLNQGAIVDTPAVGDITGDGKPEIVVGTNEEYPIAQDGGFAAGSLNTASLSVLAQSGQLSLVNSRVFAIKPTGDPQGPGDQGSGAFVGGWPAKVGSVFAELLPLVGEGVTGSPVIAPVTCANGGAGNKVGALADAGPGYIFNSDGSSCYGQTSGQNNAMTTDDPGAAAGTPKYDTPAIPALGQPAFGSLDAGTGVSFLAPSTGIVRALDLGLPEYQGGQDFVGAWNAATGQYHQGFPSAVNDLQFLTGPSIANVDSTPGDDVLAASASLDLNAMNAQTGLPVSTSWPKLTGDWVVANPLVGSFGTLETDANSHNAVIEITRAGTLFAFDTPAPSCPVGSWPRFHHDNAASGDFSRDAIAPGKPMDASISAGKLVFKAPGDDLLCGQADHYEVVTSDAPIGGGDFAGATTATPTPVAAGADQSVDIPAAPKRYVAVRAVDDQGNVGRPVVVDRTPDAGSGSGSGSGSQSAGGTSNGPGETSGGSAGGGGGGRRRLGRLPRQERAALDDLAPGAACLRAHDPRPWPLARPRLRRAQAGIRLDRAGTRHALPLPDEAGQAHGRPALPPASADPHARHEAVERPRERQAAPRQVPTGRPRRRSQGQQGAAAPEQLDALQGALTGIGGRIPLTLAAAAVAVAAAASPAAAATLHVRAGAGPGGSGSAGAPFASLAAVESAARPGDTIVVDPVAAGIAPLDGGIVLKQGQRLEGGGPPVVGGAPPDSVPVITNSSESGGDGDGVRLADDATVTNLVIRGTRRGGIYGLDSVGVTIAGNDVSNHNTSCTKGFLVQPFNVPTGIPFVGGGVAGMGTLAPQNGWAAIMVDGSTATGTIDIAGNVVHDGGCGDGIDVRAAGASDLAARVDRNLVTHLRQGTFDGAPIGSVLAIGMQARDSARLRVDQDNNTQTFIGSDGADCEGQFTNTSEAGEIDETVDHNTFAHGIGGSSCNGFETIVSNGGGSIDVTLRNSTFDDNQGDMFEEGNLGAGSTMRWDMQNVTASNTRQRDQNSPSSSDPGTNPIPFNLGDCMVLGHNGGGNSTSFRMRDSVMEGCDNGITALSGQAASNGVGPAQGLVVDIDHSRIAGNARYGLQVVNTVPLRLLHVKVANTEITGSGSYGAALDEGPAGTTDDAQLDLGGGSLGSVGGNCLLGNPKGDAEATAYSVSAKGNWWGQPGGPAAKQVVTSRGGRVDSGGGLAARPDCAPRPQPAEGSAGQSGSTPSRRLRLSVLPGHVRAGRRTRFRVRVSAAGRPVARATVRFAGHQLRTNRRGSGTVVAALRPRGRRVAVATRTGYRSARAIVVVRGQARARFAG